MVNGHISCVSGRGLDVLIRNGRLADGTGNPLFHADVAVKDGRIAAVGRLDQADADWVVDAAGKIVCPGFIDAHSHTDATVLYNRTLESTVRQGITTEIVGNCGSSFAPDAGGKGSQALRISGIQTDDGVPTSDFGAFMAYIEQRGISGNLAWLIGHNAVRNAAGVLGRACSADQMAIMKRLVSEALDAGALGFSTGLEFEPGRSADTEEIMQLARLAGKKDGIYASHIRNRDSALQPAMDEFMAIVKDSRARGQVSHLNVRYNTGAADQAWEMAVAAIEKVRGEGYDVLADITPLTHGLGQMAAILPDWLRSGGPEQAAAQLSIPAVRDRLRTDCDRYWRFIHRGDWHRITMQNNPGYPELNGLPFLEIARLWQKDPWDCYFDILAKAGAALDSVMLFGELFTDAFTQTAVQHPLFMLTTDGYSSVIEGELAEQTLFPVHYMGMIRYLTYFVRDKGILSLEEAIRKMTSMPATQFCLSDRGLIRPGMAADLVVFDYDRLDSASTYAKPLAYPVGIDHVLVNGVPVIRDGQHTGRTPGRNLLRR